MSEWCFWAWIIYDVILQDSLDWLNSSIKYQKRLILIFFDILLYNIYIYGYKKIIK